MQEKFERRETGESETQPAFPKGCWRGLRAKTIEFPESINIVEIAPEPALSTIVAGRKAEHNPDKNRLTIQFLFPKSTGGKGDAGEIILINGDVPQIVVKAPGAVLIDTECREGDSRE